jgi:hypothetical protein
MTGDSPRFMLFPQTVLSENDYRHLALLLPGLSMLQVLRPLAVPDWLSPMVVGWPVVTGEERTESIRLALKGYQEFATVHGEDSVLASLTLDKISKNFSESRLRIQSELKKKDADTVDEREIRMLEAAIFLEMARDLDEKEIEVAAGLAQMDSLEGEFREILGISDDEGIEDTLETMSPPLRADKAGLSYMLPKRIESWFRLLSDHMPPACPVLVTMGPVLEEFFEWFCAKGGAAGNVPEPNLMPLASIPAMNGLATEDFLSLLSDPEAANILTAFWRGLEDIILSPGDQIGREALSQTADALQDYLRQYCREIGISGEGTVSIELVVGDALSWNTIWKQFGQIEGSASLRGDAFCDEPVKLLVCRS